MVITIRDPIRRERIGFVNKFYSLIWTERFRGIGDFELELPLNNENIGLFQIDQYLEIYKSDNLMIVESIQYKDEYTMVIKGRSLECLLERRVQTAAITKGGNISELMWYLVNKNFHKTEEKDPYNLSSRWVDYILEGAHNIPNEEKQTLYGEAYTAGLGDVLQDNLMEIGDINDVGYRFIFNRSELTFYFTVYDGEDRSGSMIFDESRFALTNPSYTQDIRELKTSILVAGEGEDVDRKVAIVSRGTKYKNPDTSDDQEFLSVQYIGVFRREMYADARDIQREKGEKMKVYKDRLKERGIEKLSEKTIEYQADGKIFEEGPYKVRQDFDLGDIVTIRTRYFSATVKIIEVIQSWDDDGYTIYPTFRVVDIAKPEIEESFNLEEIEEEPPTRLDIIESDIAKLKKRVKQLEDNANKE